MNSRNLSIAIVILHALVVTPHSIAHTILQINMNAWQNVYIVLVILIGPLLSAVFIWKRQRVGFVLLGFFMAGSFIFGFYYHFIAAGADNVTSLHEHPWTRTFQVTAVLLALVEFAGTAAGVYGAGKDGPNY